MVKSCYESVMFQNIEAFAVMQNFLELEGQKHFTGIAEFVIFTMMQILMIILQPILMIFFLKLKKTHVSAIVTEDLICQIPPFFVKINLMKII